MKSKELQAKYKVPVYRNWQVVPSYMHTRTSALRERVIIPVDAKPDGIKNAASVANKDKVYLLFDIRKYHKK